MANAFAGAVAEKLFEVGAAGSGAIAKKGASAASVLLREIKGGKSKESDTNQNHTPLTGDIQDRMRRAHDQKELDSIRQQLSGHEKPSIATQDKAQEKSRAFSRFIGEQQAYRQMARRQQEMDHRQKLQERQQKHAEEQEVIERRNHTPISRGGRIGAQAQRTASRMRAREYKAAKSKG